jgi:HD-GYP domain-containing protein (c-di-GMP phosphodiesterase class II)
MIETQALLGKIAALRQRLEQAQGLVKDASSQVASLLSRGTDGAAATRLLERRVSAGFDHNELLETSLRQLYAADGGGAAEPSRLPAQLTGRAGRLLRHSQEFLAQLRNLAGEPLLQPDHGGPWAANYRQTTILADLILRTIQAFPESPGTQLRLTEGLEAVLQLAKDRLSLLQRGLDETRRDAQRIAELAELLAALAEGKLGDAKPFETLAAAVMADVQEGQPLRFRHESPEQPARFVAAHSWNVAQVLARVVRGDPDWRGRLPEALVAALVHDVGMLSVPVDILTQAGPLDDGQRRRIEAHPRDGAEWLARLGERATLLVEAAAQHHERIDGTGYPAGLRETQLKPLVRLLAVCDIYTAMCSPRPHRPALETRTALTDTLLLAEQGQLDRYQAERLLSLSFYPAGTVVELADGAVGLVVATHSGRRDLDAPARPVLALLSDAQGQLLPTPVHLDLAECEGRSIVRSLPARERLELLGSRYPHLV